MAHQPRLSPSTLNRKTSPPDGRSKRVTVWLLRLRLNISSMSSTSSGFTTPTRAAILNLVLSICNFCNLCQSCRAACGGVKIKTNLRIWPTGCGPVDHYVRGAADRPIRPLVHVRVRDGRGRRQGVVPAYAISSFCARCICQTTSGQSNRVFPTFRLLD